MTDATFPFDPPTELIAAALSITLSAEVGEVTQDQRARLLLAAEQLPTEGMASVWYSLRDLAIAYVRDNVSRTFAPRFNFGALINASVNAGVCPHQRWQDVFE